jgi:energy-coupling factor transport system permease protein
MNPGIKLVASILIVFAVMFTRETLVLGAAFALVSIGIVSSGLPAKMFLSVIRRTVWLLVLTFLMNAFFAGGERIFDSIPGLSYGGISLGLWFSSRLLVLLVVMWLLTSTTSPVEFSDSVDSLSRKFPWLRIAVLGVILSIAVRFIPFFFEEAQRLKKAQMSRGLEISGGALARVKGFVPILVPLIAGALRKADNLAVALEARCYDPVRRRPFVEYGFGRSELAALCLSGGCACAAIALRLA